MMTIDLEKLEQVNGGVRDSGDGKGCIPSPFPRPEPRPPVLPGIGGRATGAVRSSAGGRAGCSDRCGPHARSGSPWDREWSCR